MAIDVEKIRSSLREWIADEAFHTIAGACGDLLREYDRLQSIIADHQRSTMMSDAGSGEADDRLWSAASAYRRKVGNDRDR